MRSLSCGVSVVQCNDLMSTVCLMSTLCSTVVRSNCTTCKGGSSQTRTIVNTTPIGTVEGDGYGVPGEVWSWLSRVRHGRHLRRSSHEQDRQHEDVHHKLHWIYTTVRHVTRRGPSPLSNFEFH